MSGKYSHTVIQNAVLAYLDTKDGVYSFQSSVGAIKTSTGRFFKSGKKGNADITCCIRGVYTGLEIKAGKDVQSKAQKKAQAEIEAAGGKYYIIRCLADVKKIV